MLGDDFKYTGSCIFVREETRLMADYVLERGQFDPKNAPRATRPVYSYASCILNNLDKYQTDTSTTYCDGSPQTAGLKCRRRPIRTETTRHRFGNAGHRQHSRVDVLFA